MSSQQQQDKLKQEGNALVQKQEYEQAATVYTQALEIDSACEAAAAIFSNRSMCYCNVGKNQEALQDADKAISIRPEWPKGYLRRATAAQKLKQWQVALDSYDKYLELDPQDEAGVKNDRKAVLKIIAEKEKSAEVKESEKAEKEYITNVKDFVAAVKLFSVDRMRAVFSRPRPPRLDTPFLTKYMYSGDIHKGFFPDALEGARKLFKSEPKSFDCYLVAEFSMIDIGDIQQYPVSAHVDLINLLLDVVEEQDFVAEKSDHKLVIILWKVCMYYPGHPNKKWSSIRKDLVSALFKRIDTARKFFIGKSASNEDFATEMLSAMLANFIRGTPSEHSLADFCTPALIDCVKLALQHGANVNSTKKYRQDDHLGTILDRAIMYTHSPKIVELLIEAGADVNAVTVHQGVKYSSLTRASEIRSQDITRLLVAKGAKKP